MLKWLMLLVFAPLIVLGKAGIGLGPGEVIYNNLQIGEKYDFGELSNIKFELVNNSDSPVSVQMRTRVSSKGSVKKGYEPIPDLSWIKVYPDLFEDIKPEEKKQISVIISIPDDEKYLGKKYEVMLQAGTTGKSFLGLAVNNRILFTINKEKLEKTEEEMKKPAQFSVNPLEIYINDVGFDQEEVFGKLEVKNLSDRKITFEMVMLSAKQTGRPLRPGYEEFPSINLAKPVKNYFALEPDEEVEASVRVKVESGKLKKKKKYQLFVNVRTINETITEEFYVPIFIKMKE